MPRESVGTQREVRFPCASWLIALLFGVGCTTAIEDLVFEASVGDQVARCGDTYTLDSTKDAVQLADARLYLSHLQAQVGGDWVDVAFVEGPFATTGIGLLDFEDGTAACADSGTDVMNDHFAVELPQRDVEALRFDVGVPFETNHADPTQAVAPLTTPGMFWTWQGGYKFLRVDWSIAGDAPSRWNVHIGSTGCASDGPTLGPSGPCARPNRARIEVAYDGLSPVELDLAVLLEGLDPAVNTPDTPPGCMSHPLEPDDCAPSFAALGLAPEPAECDDDCPTQRLFRR